MGYLCCCNTKSKTREYIKNKSISAVGQESKIKMPQVWWGLLSASGWYLITGSSRQYRHCILQWRQSTRANMGKHRSLQHSSSQHHSPITPHRPNFQLLLHWGLDFNMNFWDEKHSNHNTECITYIRKTPSFLHQLHLALKHQIHVQGPT